MSNCRGGNPRGLAPEPGTSQEGVSRKCRRFGKSRKRSGNEGEKQSAAAPTLHVLSDEGYSIDAEKERAGFPITVQDQ